jgi:tRNA-dihydrouridine synthase A
MEELSPRGLTWPVSVAPMMQITDRHQRVFMRALTRRTLLYTEMITAHAVVKGDRPHLLGFDPIEHPVALQLGGDDPKLLGEACRIAQDYGYDEIDLNVGCPSSRVASGNFGACLMKDPARVRDALTAMRSAVSIPVTVKHRIGVDDLDRYEDLVEFVRVVSESGADRFIVHARKAWLKGLSPKQNRTVPPLRYADVHRLKAEFPDLIVEINGGFKTMDAAEEQLAYVDGVMIGRAANDDPWIFSDADRRFWGDENPAVRRGDVVRSLLPYAERLLSDGQKLHRITRHMLGLFGGVRGGRAWRRALSDGPNRSEATPQLLLDALAMVPGEG